MRLPSWLAQHLAGVRALLVFTVLLGIGYPLAITGLAQLPGLSEHANGSLITGPEGRPVGSRLIGQSFVDARYYFQSRPSAAGEKGYDPTASGASNLGPEDIEDTPARLSLLTRVCARSKAVGELEGVDGRRPYCTPEGAGAVLRVFATRAVSVNQPCPATPFVAVFGGVPVQCAEPGQDYSGGVLTPVRGDAPSAPVVPADAVTAGASGLDPHISVEYARLQAPRVARERGADEAAVLRLIREHTAARALGFMGEPAVNVLELNLALDRAWPRRR